MTARVVIIGAVAAGLAGCLSIAGLDETYRVGPDGTTGVTTSSGNTAGHGGMGAAGGTGGTGGTGASGGVGGTGGTGGTAATGGAGGSGDHQLVRSIARNDRDAWDDNYGSGSINRCLFGDVGWNDAGGYQFALPIPPGATIIAARLSVYPHGRSGQPTAYTAAVRIEDVDDAAAFNGASGDIWNRSFWSSTVSWDIPQGGLPLNQWSDSPSLQSLLQRVIDRAGWRQGNFVNLVVWGETNAGGSWEDVTDYSVDPANAAKLYVTYRD